MQRDKLIKDLLAAIEDFDREASRSIMVVHRKYNFILDAARELREALDGEKAPYMVVIHDERIGNKKEWTALADYPTETVVL